MILSRRRFNQYLVGALTSLALPATKADLIEGKDWRPISPPQPGDTPGKIEVLEFFSYGCPHCSSMNRLIHTWAKELPDDVAFRRVPVTFGRKAWANLARLYYSLESLGALERLDQAVFDALHEERIKLYTEPKIKDWLEEQGVDTEGFDQVFDSFDVQTQVARSDYLARQYLIDAVPSITVGGRYAVLGRSVSGLEDLLAIADELIERARKETQSA